MGFIMDGLGAEDYDRTYTDRQLVNRIIGYFKGRGRLIIGVSVLIVLQAALNVAIPILISRAIDTFGVDVKFSTAILLVGAIVASGIVAWVFNFLRQSYSARAVGDTVLTLRSDAFNAVMARDMSFYDKYSSGKIVSRVTSDTQDFANVVILTLNLLSQASVVIMIAVVLFIINVKLALLAMAIAPVVVIVALSFRRIARITTRRSRQALAIVNATVQETVSGISVAKNFRQELSVFNEFAVVNKKSYDVNVRQGLVFTGIFPILTTIAGVGGVVVLYFGGESVIASEVSFGSWYLFLEAIAVFWFPLTSVASFWSQFQLGLSASERVFALIDAEPAVVQTGDEPVGKLKGDVEFRDLDFHYIAGEKVLEGFNLAINAGETVAFVGHTGAGKSSLGKLVARFYEFQGGSLLVDGRDIRDLNLHDYRKNLGVVPQTPFLFSGTVADNIRYGKPEATDQEVENIARQVGWGEWIEGLPNGLDSDVGEGGRGLSLGQRQLVALARVMLQDPRILVLDEATASVDPLAEAQIQDSLELVMEARTAVIIAHRLSTIVNVDRIIVLKNGEIIEEGRHDELVRAGGHYSELYNTYFRHQSADYVPGTSKAGSQQVATG